ncbi:MAG: peptidoglycan-binding protein [Candidatus Omnitrophica bacterium]|nr:peptidoglycan-binding protein [Candidatus Omnitrophota bacterium]
MNRSLQMSMLVAMGVALVFSGCASKKTKQLNSMQAQIGALNDEVVRLDQALQETRAAIQSEENRRQDLKGQLGRSSSRLKSLHEEEAVIKGIYRTPSGFELPSINIQRALKNAGYYQGKLDGKIGPGTRDAVKAFQNDNGLDADGVVGRQTWGKLKSFLEIAK